MGATDTRNAVKGVFLGVVVLMAFVPSPVSGLFLNLAVSLIGTSMVEILIALVLV